MPLNKLNSQTKMWRYSFAAFCTHTYKLPYASARRIPRLQPSGKDPCWRHLYYSLDADVIQSFKEAVYSLWWASELFFFRVGSWLGAVPTRLTFGLHARLRLLAGPAPGRPRAGRAGGGED